MSKPTLLNIGCGGHFHPDWINLDVAPCDPTILKVDISRGLPFPPQFADVCYSSHVLEHLDRIAAQKLVGECFRILKSGGVLRAVVPDLEAIAREYLSVLQSVATKDSTRESDYEWMMLELYDQTTRETPGGEMSRFLTELDVANRGFVSSRIGVEADLFWSHSRAVGAGKHSKKSVRNWRRIMFLVRMKVAGLMVYIVGGKDALKSFRAGVFRSGGEVHRWMYDRHSLRCLIKQAGFENIRICMAGESRIPDFEMYSLDLTNGMARKPDSLYMEASKP